MTGVETIARIRFEHFQNGKGIKRIARELGIARDTVRKVLRSGATEFAYKRTVQPQRKLGDWVETLTAILEAEAKLPRRERRSTIDCSKNFAAEAMTARTIASIGSSRVGAPNTPGRRQAFIPLRFDPGEAYQFDWSHEAIELHGLPLTVKWRRCGSPTAGCRLCAPISVRRRRWCSTRTIAPSPFTAASVGAAFTIICDRRGGRVRRPRPRL